MGRVFGEGPDGVHHLPAVSGHRDVHPGSSLRHSPPAFLRAQKHLRLSCVSTSTPSQISVWILPAFYFQQVALIPEIHAGRQVNT